MTRLEELQKELNVPKSEGNIFAVACTGALKKGSHHTQIHVIARDVEDAIRQVRIHYGDKVRIWSVMHRGALGVDLWSREHCL